MFRSPSGFKYKEEEKHNTCRRNYILLWQNKGFPLAQLVKNPPAMQETWVQSLGWEDPLKKGKATRSNILAWIIPGTVESTGSQELDMTEWLPLSLGRINIGVNRASSVAQW